MELETMVAVASAVAALLSALYAYRSARAADKTLQLTLDEYHERHESIHAKLIEGIAWDAECAASMVAFACTLINRAASPHTIISTELHVHEFDHAGHTSELILMPVDADAPITLSSLKPIPLPINMAPRSTVSGWVTFRIPENFAHKNIDKYQVVFLNSVGQRASVEQYLIRKVENAASQD